MSLHIINPGFQTCVQDLGRSGFQKYGVIVGGAMDIFAHRIANILVGNSENTATLEMTLKGGTFEFQEDAVFSICGGSLSPEINGESIECWRPILVKKGSFLRFGQRKDGFRAYLAVAGGFTVPLVFGSSSTYLRAGIGGLQGRTLQKGDIIPFGKPGHSSSKFNWGIYSDFFAFYKNTKSIRFTRGKEFDLFTPESQTQFVQSEFTIGSNSDRMGYRLEGRSLSMSDSAEMESEAVNFGTVQVPAEGKPIILMADRQTSGGYPKIAQITQVDLPVLAQMMPGDKITFKEVSLREAQSLFLKREQEIRVLKYIVRRQLNGAGRFKL